MLEYVEHICRQSHFVHRLENCIASGDRQSVLQVVKVVCSGTSITVFYHPNSMKSTKLSKHNLATAMRFTFCLFSTEVRLPPKNLNLSFESKCKL